MSANQQAAAFGAGCFATAPRFRPDVLEIERLHRRGMGVQNIAKITGASMEDVRRIVAPPPLKPANDPGAWPLGECSDLAKNVIRYVAKQRGVDVADVIPTSASVKVNAARNAMYAAVKEFCPDLTYLDLAEVFRRDQSAIAKGIAQHNRTTFGGAGQ